MAPSPAMSADRCIQILVTLQKVDDGLNAKVFFSE